MKRIIAIILILTLLIIASPASASSSIEVFDRVGDGTWIGDTWEVNIFPGESKATTLTLYNSSNSSSEVEVTVQPDSLDDGNLIFELDKSTFTMPGGSRNDVTLSVTASGSATPSTYTAELRIEAVSPPSVTTSKARGVGIRRATLNGSLTSLGTASSADVSFEWGLTTDYGSTTELRTMTKPKTFRATITELTRGTTYYFRAKAKVDGTTSYGDEMSFTTKLRGRWWWLEWLFPWLAE